MLDSYVKCNYKDGGDSARSKPVYSRASATACFGVVMTVVQLS